MLKKLDLTRYSLNGACEAFSRAFEVFSIESQEKEYIPPVAMTLLKESGVSIAWLQFSEAICLKVRRIPGVKAFIFCGAQSHIHFTGDFQNKPVDLFQQCMALRESGFIEIEHGEGSCLVEIHDDILARRASQIRSGLSAARIEFSGEPMKLEGDVASLFLCISELKGSQLMSIGGKLRLLSGTIVDTIVDIFVLLYPNAFAAQLDRELPKIAPRHVKRALSYIEETPLKHHSPHELANLSSVSVRALQYAFVEFTGQSITEYQRLKRLDVAREMVARRDGMALTEIAELCGYQSLTAFSRAFRTAFGITPSDLRNRS